MSVPIRALADQKDTSLEYHKLQAFVYQLIGESGLPDLPGIIEIFLLPDGDDLQYQDIMMNEKCYPVFSDPEPVSRDFFRTVPDLHNIMPVFGIFCELLECKLNPDPVRLRDLLQILLCPVRQEDLVHAITT